MGPILHIPKSKEQYTDPAEQALFDYFAHTLGWGEDALHSKLTFEFLMEIRDFVGNGTILDAGAGHKRFEPFFKNAHYLSLEHPSGIEMKKMQGLRYDFVCELDSDGFLPQAESLDAIYSHSVLEHIAKPEIFFRNAMKSLKKSGRLYIHCPFMYSEHERPYDFNRFTRFGLKFWLEETGFNIVKLIPSSNAFYGATNFVLEAIQFEEKVRGMEIREITLNDGTKHSLKDVTQLIVSLVNAQFSDALYDNLSPVGWLCVAEKL